MVILALNTCKHCGVGQLNSNRSSFQCNAVNRTCLNILKLKEIYNSLKKAYFMLYFIDSLKFIENIDIFN